MDRTTIISISLNILLSILLLMFVYYLMQQNNSPIKEKVFDSPISCDCMDNFKPLWMKRSYTHYYLISELVKYQTSDVSIILERLFSINKSIGEAISTVTKSNNGTQFSLLLNEWDESFVNYCKQLNDTKPLEIIEKKLSSIVPSLSVELLSDYRKYLILLTNNLLMGNYHSSFIHLDNVSRLSQLIGEAIYSYL